MGKQKNRQNRKETGNTDWDSLAKQLKQHGFAVKEIVGDGNCLFRALGDQYEGHSRNHIQLRLQVVDFIKKNRDEFEPFIEDDVPFDEHVKNLAEPGTYGGNDAIVAFSRLHDVTIVIHQFNLPAWVIHPPGEPKKPRRELHISYHNGDHYNSVTKLSGTVEIKQSDKPASPASDNKATGKGEKNAKGGKGKNGTSPQKFKSDLSNRIEDLKISDSTSAVGKENERKDSQTSQNKGANKGMSRRQKLDQKKKDRKQEALQRKRVNSVGDSASAVVNNIATPPSVKTLTI